MGSAEDRKRLLREYRESPPPMGVFAVRNTVDGRTLIGTSRNLPGIVNRHRFALEMGSHLDKQLQADWNRLGADAFEFQALDELKPSDEPGSDPAEDLEMLLAMWIERLGLTDQTRF